MSSFIWVAFNFLTENFNVIGKIVEGSGFDDTSFQGGVCSSGSLNGVLSGRIITDHV